MEKMSREAREYLDAKIKEISAAGPSIISARTRTGSRAERIWQQRRKTT